MLLFCREGLEHSSLVWLQLDGSLVVHFPSTYSLHLPQLSLFVICISRDSLPRTSSKYPPVFAHSCENRPASSRSCSINSCLSVQWMLLSLIKIFLLCFFLFPLAYHCSTSILFWYSQKIFKLDVASEVKMWSCFVSLCKILAFTSIFSLCVWHHQFPLGVLILKYLQIYVFYCHLSSTNTVPSLIGIKCFEWIHSSLYSLKIGFILLHLLRIQLEFFPWMLDELISNTCPFPSSFLISCFIFFLALRALNTT